MKLQPRQQLLDIWQAIAQTIYKDGKWEWGGRDGSNSISDTEQLLCLMFPASELVGFKIDAPDQTSEDVLDALEAFGDSVEIPKVLLRAVGDYLDRYTGEGGRPLFGGGSYFRSADPDRDVTPEQYSLDVVDSFAMSVTLMLSTLGFLKVFRESVRRERLLREIEHVEQLAGKRLSAAMVGLLRSFSVNVFEPGSAQGRALLAMVNQTGAPERRVVEDLQQKLRTIRAGVRDLTIGSGQVREDELDNPNLLFECGWTWGVAKDAPVVETTLDVGEQPRGVALQAPFLYFTATALSSITDLFSERTRVLGLLNDPQLQLAQALQRRWDLAQAYWSTIAMYGGGRWPLEDIPWRTTDDVESEYLSLLVTAMVVENLQRNRSNEVTFDRVTRVLEELAVRGRITRRAIRNDPAVALHHPGAIYALDGSEELGPLLQWTLTDYAVTLVKRTIRVASIAPNTQIRERLVTLADEIWRHIERRRHIDGPAKGLWDHPGNAFSGVDSSEDSPSWYFTERVVEFLVEAAKSSSGPPLRSKLLSDVAADMLAEAEHLYDRELLIWAPNAGQAMLPSLRQIGSRLQRARAIILERPASAKALIADALLQLELLEAARENASEAT